MSWDDYIARETSEREADNAARDLSKSAPKTVPSGLKIDRP